MLYQPERQRYYKTNQHKQNATLDGMVFVVLSLAERKMVW